MAGVDGLTSRFFPSSQFPAQGGSAQDNMKLQQFMVPGRKNVNVLQLWTECWLNVLAQIYLLTLKNGDLYKVHWSGAPNKPNIQEFFNSVSNPGKTLRTNLVDPVFCMNVHPSQKPRTPTLDKWVLHDFTHMRDTH